MEPTLHSSVSFLFFPLLPHSPSIPWPPILFSFLSLSLILFTNSLFLSLSLFPAPQLCSTAISIQPRSQPLPITVVIILPGLNGPTHYPGLPIIVPTYDIQLPRYPARKLAHFRPHVRPCRVSIT